MGFPVSLAGYLRLLSALVIFSPAILSCSLSTAIPTVSDDAVEGLVRSEAYRILQVTADKDQASQYQLFLSDFPRRDILGMSIGGRRIYISYRLARLAFHDARYVWLLRQTLAHEVAHELSGHATRRSALRFNRATAARGVTGADVGLPWIVRFQHYSLEKELQADLEGMRLWKALNWDCRIWVNILRNFQKQNYSGDAYHPTDARLRQARSVCGTLQLPEQLPQRNLAARNIVLIED